MSYLIVVCLTIFLAMNSHAEEAQLERKSVAVVTALGIDPIPGDALFYAGKPGQGTVNVMLGMLGAVPFYMGVADVISGYDCEDFCVRGRSLMILGSFAYGPAILWDLIGGIVGVNSHNTQVEQKQSSFRDSLRPSFVVTNEGAFVGARFKF